MIAILSDLHLGLHSAPRPAELVPALVGAAEVILNGDAAESASPSHARAAEDALADLGDRLAAAGSSVVRIEGNHDPGTGALHAVRAGGAVLVTHGHAFHPTIVPWSRHATKMGEAFREAYEASASSPEPERTLLAARAAAALERRHEHARAPLAALARLSGRPWTLPLVIGYWRIFPELAARFAERAAPALAAAGCAAPRIVVSGHSHRAGAWEVRGTLVLNTGSFTFPGRPHVVTVDAGTVAIAPLVRRGGEWRQDAAARRAWRIEDVASASA